MNSSSFASTESAAKKNELLMDTKAIDKVKLYHDIWWWLEDYFYGDLSNAMYDVYYYYLFIERDREISVSKSKTECVSTVNEEKLICDPDTDYPFILKFLQDGMKSIIYRLGIEKDKSLNYLKEFVKNSYGKDLSDDEKVAIVKINTVLEAEQ